MSCSRHVGGGAGGVVPLPPAPGGAGDLRLRAWDTPSVRAAVRSVPLSCLFEGFTGLRTRCTLYNEN